MMETQALLRHLADEIRRRAARILVERWPPSLCRDLIEDLQRRLAEREAAA